MYATQMCMGPCGKVRGKPLVRFAGYPQSKHAAFGLDPGCTGEGTLLIAETSGKSRPQTVQWLVGVGDAERKKVDKGKVLTRGRKGPFNHLYNQLITTKSLFPLDVFFLRQLTWLLLQQETLSTGLSHSCQKILNVVVFDFKNTTVTLRFNKIKTNAASAIPSLSQRG